MESLGLDVNLAGSRLTVLRAIYFGRDHRLGLNELWQQMQVSRTSITNIIDGLERDGLVERAINSEDRRVIDARLTAKGKDLCANVLPKMAVFMEGLCRGFSAGELHDFSDYLARFQKELLFQTSHPAQD